MQNNPVSEQLLVSVVLPVYNGERYVIESINSILEQTYSNFELIIIDDGSTDRTAELLNEITDPRVQHITRSNLGLSSSLNFGIEMASGEFIARQDHDDISHKERLAKQVDVFVGAPEMGIVGSWFRAIDDASVDLGGYRSPTSTDALRSQLQRHNPLCHGSIMLRKSAVVNTGLYNEYLPYAQDYELWLRMVNAGITYKGVPQYLYSYRISPESVARGWRKHEFIPKIRSLIGDSTTPIVKVPELKLEPVSERFSKSLYLYTRGSLIFDAGDRLLAIREFSKAAATYPANWRAWGKLGLSLAPSVISNRLLAATRCATRQFAQIRFQMKNRIRPPHSS